MHFSFAVLLLLPFVFSDEFENTTTQSSNTTEIIEPGTNSSTTTESPLIPCVCGIFLSGTLKKGSKEPPKEFPTLSYEQTDTFPCSNIGNKMCTNRCLESVSI